MTGGRSLIVRGDAAHLPLPDSSVDLIVTSPPYFGQRTYTDGGVAYDGQVGAEPTVAEYIGALVRCTAEWARVLKPSGSIFVNLGDAYYSGKGAPGAATMDPKNRGRDARRTEAVSPLDRSGLGFPKKSLLLLPERYRIACLDKLGLTVRQVVVWHKPNGMPESVTDRCRRSHEDWVHLTVEPRYYANLDSLREEPKRCDPPRLLGTSNKTPRHAAAVDNTGWKNNLVTNHPLGKLPSSVWNIATEPLRVPDELGVDHYAAFPTAWPRQLITGWCPEGGLVVDPFGGTGTTSLVAAALGRTGISVDLSMDYGRVATWRTNDPAQRARALVVDKPPVQLDGQLDLFDARGDAR